MFVVRFKNIFTFREHCRKNGFLFVPRVFLNVYDFIRYCLAFMCFYEDTKEHKNIEWN